MILLLFSLGNGEFWWRGDRGPVWSLYHWSIPLPAKKAPKWAKLIIGTHFPTTYREGV